MTTTNPTSGTIRGVHTHTRRRIIPAYPPPGNTAAAQQRMAIQAYQLRAVVEEFTRFGPGSRDYTRCLAAYYAEAIHHIADAHLLECPIPAGGDCHTCNGIRVALTGLGADLLVERRIARLANRLKDQQ
jgi:hypothetical protein